MLAAMGALVLLGAAARWTRRAGLGSVLRAVRDGLDRVFLRLGWPPLSAEVDGVTVRGYLRHRSFLAHLASGTYEPEHRRMFERALSPGAIVVDGGAHVGTYTIVACRRVGAAGRVFAVEPDPYNAAALERNVRAAGCTNVTIVRKALADVPGRARFHQSLGTISSSFVARSGRGPFRELETEVTSIDALLEGIELDALVVKLDVEGAEPRAVAGAARSVGRAASVTLFVESNRAALAAADGDAVALREQLGALGFTTTTIEDDADAAVGPVNLYCVLER